MKEQEAKVETPDPQPSWRLDVNRLSYRINTSHSPIIHGRNLPPQRPGRVLASFWGGRVSIRSCVDQNCDSMGWGISLLMLSTVQTWRLYYNVVKLLKEAEK